jgi:hypothetical protein
VVEFQNNKVTPTIVPLKRAGKWFLVSVIIVMKKQQSVLSSGKKGNCCKNYLDGNQCKKCPYS